MALVTTISSEMFTKFSFVVFQYDNFISSKKLILA